MDETKMKMKVGLRSRGIQQHADIARHRIGSRDIRLPVLVEIGDGDPASGHRHAGGKVLGVFKSAVPIAQQDPDVALVVSVAHADEIRDRDVLIPVEVEVGDGRSEGIVPGGDDGLGGEIASALVEENGNVIQVVVGSHDVGLIVLVQIPDHEALQPGSRR